MAKYFRNLFRLLVKFISVSLFDGIIEVTEKGFWQKRYPPKHSLEKTAELFNQIGGKIIIEVGTGIHGAMSGNSVMVWARKTNAERVIAVDIAQERIDQVSYATAQYSNVETVLRDGIEFIREFQGIIDLLYLDFWAPDLEDGLPGIGRATAYSQAYLKARDKMNLDSLILIDDTDHIHPYKHTLIVPEARKDGFKVLWEGRQTLLLRRRQIG